MNTFRPSCASWSCFRWQQRGHSCRAVANDREGPALIACDNLIMQYDHPVIWIRDRLLDEHEIDTFPLIGHYHRLDIRLVVTLCHSTPLRTVVRLDETWVAGDRFDVTIDVLDASITREAIASKVPVDQLDIVGQKEDLARRCAVAQTIQEVFCVALVLRDFCRSLWVYTPTCCDSRRSCSRRDTHWSTPPT